MNVQHASRGAPLEIAPDELDAGATLLKAVAADDFSGIARAKQAGADPAKLYPDSENGGTARISAAGQWLRCDSSAVLIYILGEGQKTVPLAYENDEDGAVGLFDMLAQKFKQDKFQFQQRWPSVQRCFDFTSLSVAHSTWDMANKMLAPDGEGELVHVSEYVYALQVLALGAMPAGGPAEWERFLSVHVKMDQAGEEVSSMAARTVNCPDARALVKQMIASGVDPDLRVHGLPLLIHASANPDIEVSKMLMEAGADIHATCTPEDLFKAFPNLQFHGLPLAPGAPAGESKTDPLGEVVKGADVARMLGNNELASLYGALYAKSAIDAVLQRAHDKREEP